MQAPTPNSGNPALKARSNDESRTAIACLAHPYTLVALATLAFNDHFLKGVGPGWLTGKLSDFAGLFYFPFLVIAIVALLRRRGGLRGPAVAPIVFGAVGVWFAAAKAIPVVHAATVALAEVFVGTSQVVRDPTDAIAVLALLPAWKLYRHIANSPRRTLSEMFRAPILGAAVLLTAATSRPRAPSVTDLVVVEDKIFAVVTDDHDRNHGDVEFFETFDGIDWQTAAPSEDFIEHQQTSASTADARLRLRDRLVEIESDDGVWRPVFDAERERFLATTGAKKSEALDIVVDETQRVVVVAFGRQGIAVRTPDGHWSRRALGGARPSPSHVSTAGSIDLLLRGQWVFGAAAALIAWCLISILAWSTPRVTVPVASSRQPRKLSSRLGDFAVGPIRLFRSATLRGRSLLFGLAGLLVPLLLFILFIKPPDLSGDAAIFAALPALPLFALSILLIAIGWRGDRSPEEGKPRTHHFLASLPAGLAAAGMLVLWDTGWLQSLSSALGLAVAAVFVVVWIGAARISRHTNL